MNQKDFGETWRNPDSDYFIRFMDRVNALDFFKNYKRHCIERMQLRPGQHVLDVGCGTGEDAQAIAQGVAPSGRIVGLDISETMIGEARQRAEGKGLPVEYCVGDAHHLDFNDSTFDIACTFSAFEILADPRQALKEMIRTVKPGGFVIVPGPDPASLAINGSDHALNRRIVDHFADKAVNGWLGRNLRGLFVELGMKETHVVPLTMVLTDLVTARDLWLQSIADNARDAGVVSAAEAASWLADLEQSARADRFFWGSTTYIVSGRKKNA